MVAINAQGNKQPNPAVKPNTPVVQFDDDCDDEQPVTKIISSNSPQKSEPPKVEISVSPSTESIPTTVPPVEVTPLDNFNTYPTTLVETSVYNSVPQETASAPIISGARHESIPAFALFILASLLV
ncbi:hypothetical protein HDV02_003198 [Globomyces sp. JEL0801]|nr:hypothetical protein HDV02_003198 [Globomyces sp. JEL0801]